MDKFQKRRKLSIKLHSFVDFFFKTEKHGWLCHCFKHCLREEKSVPFENIKQLQACFTRKTSAKSATTIKINGRKFAAAVNSVYLAADVNIKLLQKKIQKENAWCNVDAFYWNFATETSG